MQTVVVDYETYWSQTYSLSKLTPIEYVFGDEFEVQTCATKIGTEQTIFTIGYQETKALFNTIDWDNSALIGHNASGFDHLISRFVFGVKPRLWLDTMDMARPFDAKFGLSLKALAKRYGLPDKGSLETVNTKGKRLSEFTQHELQLMREYNVQDTDITYELFRILRKKTSADDLRLIDLTARMLLFPQFEADTNLLQRGLAAERNQKQRQLLHLAKLLNVESAEEVRAMCASQPKFKALLESLGECVPTKTSPRTGKDIPAIAKTDKAMEALLEHDNPTVAAAAQARIGVKSTQLESRIERFLVAADAFGGRMPVPLRYAGADTTLRFSGTFKLNMQNLPRIGKKPAISDVLRRSLRAPEGYKVVVADESAIELRVNHTLWQVEDTMRRFKEDPKADVYKAFAAVLYCVSIEDVTKEQRFSGKVAQLQLGYRSGAAKLADAARIMSGGAVTMSLEEAKQILWAWRTEYKNIYDAWRTLDEAIVRMDAEDNMFPLDEWGLCYASKHGIKTPKAVLTYPGLTYKANDNGHSEWYYKSSRGMKKIHGGVLCENLCQHLAGQVMRDAILAFDRTALGKKYKLAHQVHDEAIYVVKDKDAQAVLDQLQECMRKPPDWWPELVTWSEGAYAQDYGSVEK